MEILLCLIYALFFIFLIYKMKFFDVPVLSRKLISGVFVLKNFAGLLLWAIYTFYYTDRSTADIFKYFDDSKIMYDALFTHPWDYLKMLFGFYPGDVEHYFMQMNYWYRANENALFNDSHSIIRFNAFVRLFSFGFYNVHTVFICFLSLLGLMGFYKALLSEIKKNERELFLVVFLLPSVLFWGSGVLKDALLLFSFGMCFYFFIHMLSENALKLKSVILFSVFAGLFFITKPYVFIAIFPGMIAYYWAKHDTGQKAGLKFLFVHGVFFLLVFNIHHLFINYNFAEILYHKQVDFLSLVQASKPGSVIQINPIEPNFLSIIKNIPQAITNTFFSPVIFTARSPIILLAALENVFIFMALFLSVLSIKGKQKMSPLFYLTFFFVIITFTLIGLITPVVGAIVRYKAIASMFLLVSLLTFYDKNTLMHRFHILLNKIKGK